MLRLITIPISHYCEKARWALDRAGIEYREERHIQGVHQIAGPAVVPPEYTVELPQPDALPADARALVERAREHPAGAHALNMFRQHRRERVAVPG